MICSNFSLLTFFCILQNNRVLIWLLTYGTVCVRASVRARTCACLLLSNAHLFSCNFLCVCAVHSVPTLLSMTVLRSIVCNSADTQEDSDNIHKCFSNLWCVHGNCSYGYRCSWSCISRFPSSDWLKFWNIVQSAYLCDSDVFVCFYRWKCCVISLYKRQIWLGYQKIYAV
jgi:hypothetical protein